MSKYQLLSEHFELLPGDAWQATFEDIERIVGFRLPASARAHQAWWANSADHMPQKAAWMDAGWRTRDLNLTAGHVLFVRETAGATRSQRPLDASQGALRLISANTPHAWNTACQADVRVGLAWTPIGRVVLDAGGKLAFPAAAAAVPALYRFRIRNGAAEKRYIGQTENLARRLALYRNPGLSQQTNVRLNAEFLRALGACAEISVAVVTEGAWIDRGAGPAGADMTSLAVRCLLENAALLAERATGIESLNRSELA